LEYRDELDGYRANFRNGFAFQGGKPVKDHKVWEVEHSRRMDAFRDGAQAMLDSWSGTGREKSQLVLRMVEAEMKECTDFVDEVLSALKRPPQPAV